MAQSLASFVNSDFAEESVEDSTKEDEVAEPEDVPWEGVRIVPWQIALCSSGVFGSVLQSLTLGVTLGSLVSVVVLGLDQAPFAAVVVLVAAMCHAGTTVAITILWLVRKSFIVGRHEACRAASVTVVALALQIAYYGAARQNATGHH